VKAKLTSSMRSGYLKFAYFGIFRLFLKRRDLRDLVGPNYRKPFVRMGLCYKLSVMPKNHLRRIASLETDLVDVFDDGKSI
jgi:hypothetical protein